MRAALSSADSVPSLREAGIVDALLEEPSPDEAAAWAWIEAGAGGACLLPRRPFADALARRMDAWRDGAPRPEPAAPIEGSEGRDAEVRDAVARAEPLLGRVHTAAGAAAVLEALGPGGVMLLLGFARTAGSVNVLPPRPEAMLAAFREPHRKGGREMPLTVGGRAFTKHAPRSSDGWWGRTGGSDADKNEAALDAVRRVLAAAEWVNSHRLPGHGVDVFEVRTAQGYGARWTADGLSFRGFLETPMENGHAVGWRH